MIASLNKLCILYATIYIPARRSLCWPPQSLEDHQGCKVPYTQVVYGFLSGDDLEFLEII